MRRILLLGCYLAALSQVQAGNHLARRQSVRLARTVPSSACCVVIALLFTLFTISSKLRSSFLMNS
jgi:hypothetical protein